MKKDFAIIVGIIVVVCVAVVLIRNPFYLESKEPETNLSFHLDELYYVDWVSSTYGNYRVYYQDTTDYESQQVLLDMIFCGLEGNYVYDRTLDSRQADGGDGNQLTLYDENDVVLGEVCFNRTGELYVATKTNRVYWVYIPVDAQFPSWEDFVGIYEKIRDTGERIH